MPFKPAPTPLSIARLVELVLDKFPPPSINPKPKEPRLLPMREFECSPDDSETIRKIFAWVQTKVIPHIRSWNGVGPDLADALKDINVPTTDIGCEGCGAPWFYSGSKKYTTPGAGGTKYALNLCAGNDATGSVRDGRLQWGLLGELVSLAGGRDLDRLVLQYYFIASSWEIGNWSGPGRGPGTMTPTTMLMCLESDPGPSGWTAWRVGKYMAWNPTQGSVGVLAKAPLVGVLTLFPHIGSIGSWQAVC